jgi:hypothetical protein
MPAVPVQVVGEIDWQHVEDNLGHWIRYVDIVRAIPLASMILLL